MAELARAKAIECPVCLDDYKDPRMLTACGNSFCSGCVQKLIDAPPSRATVACPTCRQQSLVPSNGFPENFGLSRKTHVITFNTRPLQLYMWSPRCKPESRALLASEKHHWNACFAARLAGHACPSTTTKPATADLVPVTSADSAAPNSNTTSRIARKRKIKAEETGRFDENFQDSGIFNEYLEEPASFVDSDETGSSNDSSEWSGTSNESSD